MRKTYLHMKKQLTNDCGAMSIYSCFFVLGVVILISFLLLYASIKITCINIRNGAKMELNNLSASIYADTYRPQRETNFGEYLNTLYSSSSYTSMLEDTVRDGLANKIPLATDKYQIRNIGLAFHVELHYNNAGMSQFYFRFIRYTSTEYKDIYFLTYAGSIESNLMQMVLAKEKLNLFMKGQDVDLDTIYEKFDIDYDLLSMMMVHEKDEKGVFHIRWDEQKIA